VKQQTILVGVTSFFSVIAIFLAVGIANEPDSDQQKQKSDGSEDTAKTQPTKLTKDQIDLINKVFSSRLIEIASEYKRYDRVDQTIRWAPTMCAAPPQRPENLASLSASDSESTHGKKLYFLYARKPWEYKSNVWGVSDRSGEDVRAPLGQVLVKEAWNPVKIDPANRDESDTNGDSSNDDTSKNAKQLRPYATDGGNTYRAGDKKGLFIMFKTKESTPGTDRGWVYGTVSADGTEVTSVGLVKNCMDCHQDARYDRQVGLAKPLQR